MSRCVGIGRRCRLKICCSQGRVGSSPTTGIQLNIKKAESDFCLFCLHKQAILYKKYKARNYTFLALSKSDPDENRTRVSAVKGRCLSRLTTGPKKWIMESGKWKVYQDHHTTISEILW